MKILALGAVATLSALTLSACGMHSSSTASGTTTPSSTPSNSPHPASAASHGLHLASTSLGKVLVDAQGMTVYMLTADHAGHSSCSAACLQYWPPVSPERGTATVTAKIATATTTGGAKIATAGGWPLYTFIQDQKPGDVTGEGMKTFGGTWYAVSAAGKPVTGSTKGSSGPSKSSAPAYHSGY